MITLHRMVMHAYEYKTIQDNTNIDRIELFEEITLKKKKKMECTLHIAQVQNDISSFSFKESIIFSAIDRYCRSRSSYVFRYI